MLTNRVNRATALPCVLRSLSLQPGSTIAQRVAPTVEGKDRETDGDAGERIIRRPRGRNRRPGPDSITPRPAFGFGDAETERRATLQG